MIDVKELRERIAKGDGLFIGEVVQLLDALEAQAKALEAAAALAEKLEAAVNKHGGVWVKPYYSEYKETLVLLDNYRAAREGGMKKKYKLHQWQPVKGIDGRPERFAVPGGWVYRETWGQSGAMCFVPDPSVEIEE